MLEKPAAPPVPGPVSKARLPRFRQKLHGLYNGRSPSARRFQLAVISIDFLTIAFFIATPVLQDKTSFLWIDSAVAVLLAADLIARALASPDIGRWLLRPFVWVDLFVLATLLAPYWLINYGFLRILRLWSLSRSGILWRPLRGFGLRKWEEAGRSIVNLVTFLLVATGFVYTSFFRSASGFTGYVDALYFTVATVTTTGFGDITLPGPTGKLTSIVTMLIGISLFVRLAQAIFRPYKVDFVCPQCALQRHEPDAVHCKACGLLLKIPDMDD